MVTSRRGAIRGVFFLFAACLIETVYNGIKIHVSLSAEEVGAPKDAPVLNDFRKSSAVTDQRNRTDLVPFERQDGVVIVTKVHGPNQQMLLDQSLCLLHHAYNKKPLYDIVVFTSEPLSEVEIATTRNLVAPAKLTTVLDNRGSLHEEIAALSSVRRRNFLAACNVSSAENLTWWSDTCGNGRLNYNWQAEFRGRHIWTHPALMPYQYMLWLDSDSFCTKAWPKDPIKTMIEEDLVILFNNWPQGGRNREDVHERIHRAFDVSICGLKLVKGKFVPKLGNPTQRDTTGSKSIVQQADSQGSCQPSRFGYIHGFFHITNLGFFRSEGFQRWANIWIGDGFLQRQFDDQGVVTVASILMALNRTWEMRQNGIRLDVFHNGLLDGKKKEPVGGFKKYWETTVRNQLPSAAGLCPIKAAN